MFIQSFTTDKDCAKAFIKIVIKHLYSYKEFTYLLNNYLFTSCSIKFLHGTLKIVSAKI